MLVGPLIGLLRIKGWGVSFSCLLSCDSPILVGLSFGVVFLEKENFKKAFVKKSVGKFVRALHQ